MTTNQCPTNDDAPARQVAAMQFAGGRSIAQLAEEWERSTEWVELAIREAILATIPMRDGGLKPPRSEVRAEEQEKVAVWIKSQGRLGW